MVQTTKSTNLALSVGAFSNDFKSRPIANPQVQLHGALHTPNLSLNSDPACIAFRSLSAFRYLGSARRIGAGEAA